MAVSMDLPFLVWIIMLHLNWVEFACWTPRGAENRIRSVQPSWAGDCRSVTGYTPTLAWMIFPCKVLGNRRGLPEDHQAWVETALLLMLPNTCRGLARATRERLRCRVHPVPVNGLLNNREIPDTTTQRCWRKLGRGTSGGQGSILPH